MVWCWTGKHWIFPSIAFRFPLDLRVGVIVAIWRSTTHKIKKKKQSHVRWSTCVRLWPKWIRPNIHSRLLHRTIPTLRTGWSECFSNIFLIYRVFVHPSLFFCASMNYFHGFLVFVFARVQLLYVLESSSFYTKVCTIEGFVVTVRKCALSSVQEEKTEIKYGEYEKREWSTPQCGNINKSYEVVFIWVWSCLIVEPIEF